MEKFKNILYIHGINSSGETGKLMDKLFKEKYGNEVNVIAPVIPANYDEAKFVINDILKNNKIDFIIGTSLGGFMTLTCHGYLRIAVNPTFEPSKTLPKIGVSKEISESYIKAENDIINLIDYEDRMEVYGAFGNKDDVVNHQNLFSRYFLKSHMFIMNNVGHRLTESAIKDYIFNIVDEIR